VKASSSAKRKLPLQRATGALGVRAGGIQPEAQRHANRVRQGAEKCHRAVHAAAHRDGDAARRRRRAEHGPDCVRERVGRERLAADARRLEQRQPGEVAVEARRVRLDDPVAGDAEPHRSPLAAATGVSKDLVHAETVDEPSLSACPSDRHATLGP
jgi:hypothetical protein